MTATAVFRPSERALLLALGLGAMAERTGSTIEAAEEQLDQYELHVRGDAHEVVLEVAGQRLVRVSRAWLTEHDGHRRA